MIAVVLRIPPFVFSYPRTEQSNSVARLGSPVGGEKSQAVMLGLPAAIDAAQDNWLGSPA